MPVCNGLSTNGLSSICALSCTILVHIFSYFTLSRYTFFMLHFFDFTLSMLHFFHFEIFSCCTFFAKFSLCTLVMFIFSCYIKSILRYFHTAFFRIALFSRCTFSCFTPFMLHLLSFAFFSCSTLFMLHFFPFAFFSCCTFFLLQFFSLDFQFWLVWCCSYYMVHFSLLYFPHAAHISRCTLPCSIHFMLQLFPAVIFVLFWYRSLFTFFCFYATFFSLLCLSRDTFHNLQRLIQLDYNPHSIII